MMWLQLIQGMAVVLFLVTAGAAVCIASDMTIDHRAVVAWLERYTGQLAVAWSTRVRLDLLVLVVNGECRWHRAVHWRPTWNRPTVAVVSAVLSYRRAWNQPTGAHRLSTSSLLPSSEVIQSLIAERNAHASQDLGS